MKMNNSSRFEPKAKNVKEYEAAAATHEKKCTFNKKATMQRQKDEEWKRRRTTTTTIKPTGATRTACRYEQLLSCINSFECVRSFGTIVLVNLSLPH